MKFHLPTAEIFVPDDLPVEQALIRTTHMCIAAHQDDIEIMAAGPILDCFQQEKLGLLALLSRMGAVHHAMTCTRITAMRKCGLSVSKSRKKPRR